MSNLRNAHVAILILGVKGHPPGRAQKGHGPMHTLPWRTPRDASIVIAGPTLGHGGSCRPNWIQQGGRGRPHSPSYATFNPHEFRHDWLAGEGPGASGRGGQAVHKPGGGGGGGEGRAGQGGADSGHIEFHPRLVTQAPSRKR